MRKKFTLLFASLFACVGVMAQTYYQPGNRTATLEAGKQYFVSIATYYGSACTNLLHNNGGDLAKSDLLPTAVTNNPSFLFTVEEVGDSYLAYIKNSDGKYLQADNLASAEEKTGVYVIPYFEAKAVCCGNDVDACDENGNRIVYDNITAETPIVTVQKESDYTNPDNRNGWRYIVSLSAGQNWCTAFAFYEAVEIDNTIINEKKETLAAAIQSAKSLFATAQFEALGGGAVALQTTNPTGAGYISCNNIDPQEGNNMEYLIDGKPETYIHSNWHTISSEKDYLDVYLGEGNGLSVFHFSEVTRSGASNDFPQSIEILGSVDGSSYTTVTTVSGLPTSAGASYKSPAIECDPSYIYLRFVVTGSNYKADRPYFHMAEFGLSTPLELKVSDGYKSKDKVLYGLSLVVAQAETVVEGTDVTAIDEAKASIDAYFAEINKVYPFVLTTDDENPVLYTIRSGRGDACWYTYNAEDGMIALSEYTAAQTQYWYFKEIATDDYKCALQFYPYLGEGKAMSYENTNDGPEKIVAKALETEGWTNLWNVVDTEGNAPYGLQTYNKKNYLSNHGGAGKKMGMYNAAPGKDEGTAMYILTPAEAVQGWIEKAKGITFGAMDAVGFCTSVSVEKLNAAIATTEQNVANKNYSLDVLKAALEALETIQPDPDKFYTIASAMDVADNRSGQMMYINADSCLQYRPEYNDSAVFQFVPAGEGKFYLLNVKNKTYLSTAKTHNGGQAEMKAETVENAKAVVITNMGRANVVKIVPVGGAMLHAQAIGSKVVGWDEANNAAASAWVIEEYDPTNTAVDLVEVQEEATVIYDLLGRRVEKMEKGIYIVNGKKVLVK